MTRVAEQLKADAREIRGYTGIAGVVRSVGASECERAATKIHDAVPPHHWSQLRDLRNRIANPNPGETMYAEKFEARVTADLAALDAALDAFSTEEES